MHLGFQPHAAHAHRLAHALLVVDHVFLRQHVQGLLIGGNRHRLGGVDHPVDVRLGHFPVADRDDAMGVKAAHMGTGDAGVDRMDLAAGHQLRLFHGTLNRAHGGFDVHHHALLHAPRRLGAQTHYLHNAFLGDLADDGHDLGGADVQAHDHVVHCIRH